MTIFGLDNISSESLEATSKGNQRKWQEQNRFIKADTFIEESQNELLAYQIGEALGLNVTPYFVCRISVDGKTLAGCYSLSFLGENDVYISVAHILENALQTFSKNTSAQALFDAVSTICASFTQIDLVKLQAYWYQMLLFDFLICNEDRHTNNFGFIFDSKQSTYQLAPLFDHGLSFLTNREKYSNDPIIALRKFKTKPFSSNPIKNMILDKPCLDVTPALSVLQDIDQWRADIVRHQVALLKN